MNTTAQYIAVADHTKVIALKDSRIAALEQQQIQWQEQHCQWAQQQREWEERCAVLTATAAELKAQVDWFKRQIFGRKSEKLLTVSDPRQLSLGEVVIDTTPPPPTETVESYQRRVSQAAPPAEPSETLLRFDASVPVQVITVLPDEVKDLSEDDCEGTTAKLSQQRSVTV